MGQPIYATPNKPFLTNTYLELYVIIGITIFSGTVLFCIFKDVKRRDAIRRTLSGARPVSYTHLTLPTILLV